MRWNEIRRHAELVAHAYKDPEHVYGNAQWDTHGETLYIAGTNDPGDWIENAGVRVSDDRRVEILARESVPGVGDVHAGFWDHAAKILDNLRIRPRLVVGHSLGGAAAQHIGAFLAIPALTFGAPRAWVKGGKCFLDHHHRIYHRGDPVPHVPPWCSWQHRQSTAHAFGGVSMMELLGLRSGMAVASRIVANHSMASYIEHARQMEAAES